MKAYEQLDAEGYAFRIGNISFTTGHRYHTQMQREIDAGEAEILPYVAPPLPDVGDIPITAADEDEIIRLRPANRPTPSEISAQQQSKRDRGEA